MSLSNPENPDAWKLALELAKEKDADIVLATDPDATDSVYTARIQRQVSM